MGIDVHEWRRYHGKEDPNPAARQSRTSSADWQTWKGRGAKIGAFYRVKRLERIYRERYLGDDSNTA